MAADSPKEKFSDSCKEKGKAVSRHKYCSLSPLSSQHYSPLFATCLWPRGGGGYSHTLPIRVCAAQRGRDFEAPDLERGIHFRGVF